MSIGPLGTDVGEILIKIPNFSFTKMHLKISHATCWPFCPGEDAIMRYIQYIPRNMHTVFALLCFVVVIHWLIFPYPSGSLHWYCGNLTNAPVPAKQPWWIWINTSCEFIMKDCITTTKQSTTKPCAYFLGYTVSNINNSYDDSHLSLSPSNVLDIAVCSGAIAWHLPSVCVQSGSFAEN